MVTTCYFARPSSGRDGRARPRKPADLRPRGSCRNRPAIEPLEGRQLLALVIHATFDSSITNDPNAATIEATINRTIAAYQNLITDNVTVDITFQEGGGLGGSSGGLLYFIKYSDLRAAMVNHATTTDDNSAIASMPNQSTDPINGNDRVSVRSPLARALGFNAPNAGGAAGDGTITLNTAICNLDRTSTQDPNKYDLQAVAAHEIDEILGFGSSLQSANNGDPAPTGMIQPDDLFRYDEKGARSYTTSSTAQAYFSIDGGATDLARFNQTHTAAFPGDYGDWYSFFGGQVPQVQDAFNTPGATANLDAAELTRLDVLGYTLALHTPQVTAASNQTAVEGASKSFNLGSFTDPDAAPWGVTVSWGDGSPDTTFFLNGAGSLGAKPHTYAEEGNYTVTVTVNDFTSQAQSKTFKVSVSDPSVVGTGVPVFAVDCRTITVSPATFTDPGGPEDLGDYAASIDWGDATGSSTGVVSDSGGGVFVVTGSHAYASRGIYTITITIDHESSVPTVVTATATIRDDLGLLLLDPSSSGALLVANNGSLLVTGCGAVVVDSDAAYDAMIVSENGKVVAEQITVSGGVRADSNATISPTPDLDAPIPDPLGLALPSPPSSLYGPVYDRSLTPLILYPGTYFGGIHIAGNASVTLAPGVYYMAGGGFTASDNAKVFGNGVLIVNAPYGPGDVVSLTGRAQVNLTALASGPSQGLAIFQDPASSNSIIVTQNATLNMTGVLYAAHARVIVRGNGFIKINPGPGTASLPPIEGAMIAYGLYDADNGRVVINPDAEDLSGPAIHNEASSAARGAADINAAAISSLVGGGASSSRTGGFVDELVAAQASLNSEAASTPMHGGWVATSRSKRST